MKDALDIDWAEATAYEMTGALRFSGVLADDDYQSEQVARMELAAILRRRCVPIGQDELSRQSPPERGKE